MRNRRKTIDDILSNVLEIMPPDTDTLNVVIEYPEVKQMLELEIKLSITEIE